MVSGTTLAPSSICSGTFQQQSPGQPGASPPAGFGFTSNITPAPAPPPQPGEDLREYMHGIEAVTGADGNPMIFFSSNGLPPTKPGNNWAHDVYTAHWTDPNAQVTTPTIFLQNPEAQEPVSVSQTTDTHIMVTFEDGWNTPNQVDQRYGVYTSGLQPIAPYPLEVMSGGHSGHTAAVGQNFVVFYSQDWVDGGGVDNLGTGDGVYVSVFDSNGTFLRAVDVAPKVREWWPIIAGSSTHALLVWQQYVDGQTYANLKIAVLDPVSGAVTAARVLQQNLQYYTYSTAYVQAIDQFIVVGTTFAGKGFAYLIDENGQTTATLSCMPATVREARIAVHGATAYTPSQPGHLLQFALTPSSITLQAMQPSPLSWWYMGSVGLVGSSTLHWVSLTPRAIAPTIVEHKICEFDVLAV